LTHALQKFINSVDKLVQTGSNRFQEFVEKIIKTRFKRLQK